MKNELTMKEKLVDSMAKFAKSMVQPLMYVSIVGIVMLIGIILTNQGIRDAVPFLNAAPIQFVGNLIYNCLMFIINNLGVLFCVGIAGAMAKSSRQHAGLIALMSYFIFLIANNNTLQTFNRIAEQTMFGLSGTGQAMVFGIQVVDMGVFSGIILGCIVGYIFNKFDGHQFNGYFSIFSGVRLPFAIMIIISMVLGWGTTFVWPYVQQAIGSLTGFIKNSGNIGLFIYGALNKLLIPTGLHHLIYTPFMFTDIGGTLQLGDTIVNGAYAIRTAELNAGLPFSDATYWLSFTFINIFGYVALALAFVKTAFKENKAKVKQMLIPLTVAVVISSITEPMDFLFCFAAPLLFVVFSMISGLSMVLLKVFAIPVATSGGIINSTLANVLAGYERTRWPLMFVIALVMGVVVYFVAVFLITKFNMATPGREKVDNSAKSTSNNTSKEVATTGDESSETMAIIKGLGGKENIVSVDNCFTRLRVTLKEASLISEETINQSNNSGIIKKGNDIQIIYGMKVGKVRKSVEEMLEVI